MMSVSKLSEDRVYPGAMLRSIRYSVMRAKKHTKGTASRNYTWTS